MTRTLLSREIKLINIHLLWLPMHNPFLGKNNKRIHQFFKVVTNYRSFDMSTGSVLLIFLVLCVVLLCIFTFWVPCCDVRYDFRINTMVRFVVCSPEDSCPVYIISVLFTYIVLVVSNTYCVVFLYCFSSYCVPYYVASFTGLSIFDCTFGIF